MKPIYDIHMGEELEHAILKESSPINVFGSADTQNAKVAYRKLIKIFHPDIYRDKVKAHEITQHLNRLYSDLMHGYTATSYPSVSIQLAGNKRLNFSYLYDYEIDTGQVYVLSKSIIIKFHENVHLKKYLESLNSLTFANDEMKKEFERQLPKIEKVFDDGVANVIVLNRLQGVHPLRAVLEKFGNKLPHKASVWVCSRLHSLLCFLSFNKKAHNAICVDNIFVDASTHTILLLLGWEFARTIGEPLKELPVSSFGELTPEMKALKRVSSHLDFLCLKQVMRMLTGDITGSKQVTDAEMPETLRNWLLTYTTTDSFEAYAYWDSIIDKFWGKRKFVPLDIENLYST